MQTLADPLRCGAVVARQPHKLEVVSNGAIPTNATITGQPNRVRANGDRQPGAIVHPAEHLNGIQDGEVQVLLAPQQGTSRQGSAAHPVRHPFAVAGKPTHE